MSEAPCHGPLRVLLIARHYPPDVSAGARRPYLLKLGLEACDARVHVVAPALSRGTDGTAVPPKKRIADTAAPAIPTPRASGARRLRAWALTHLSLPDPELRWALRAAAAGRRAARTSPFDLIITTSPPESIHVAGALLATRLQTPWVADLRDRWLDAPLMRVRESRLRRTVERPLARSILSRANLLTATDPPALDEAQRLAPRVPVLRLPQASPPATPQREISPSPAAIRVVHTGSFSLSHGARDIGPALDLLARARGIDPRFELHLIGRLTEEEEARARQAGAQITGPVALEDAWAAQAAADVLLLVAAPGTEAVPGKLAEYRAAGRPVVILGGGSWRALLPGGQDDPLVRLLSFADPARREVDIPPPGPTPEAVAASLLAFVRNLAP